MHITPNKLHFHHANTVILLLRQNYWTNSKHMVDRCRRQDSISVTEFCNGRLLDVVVPELDVHWRSRPPWRDIITSRHHNRQMNSSSNYKSTVSMAQWANTHLSHSTRSGHEFQLVGLMAGMLWD